MDFISAWALPILFLLAIADRTTAILIAVLLAAARLTGPFEATAAVACGAALLAFGLWQVGYRLKKAGKALPQTICDYTIRQWLENYGPAKTAALTTLAVNWRFSSVVSLSAQISTKSVAFPLSILLPAVWTSAWILLLMPVADFILQKTTTLTHVRMTLPGLMLLAFVTAVVLRTGLTRLYQRYFVENKHENSSR